VVELVLRLARDNARWGYVRIAGECRKLGVTVSATSVRTILRQHRLGPAPRRGDPTWTQFLRTQAAGALAATDLARLPEEVSHGPSHVGILARCRAERRGRRVKRSALAGLAGYGFCASHARWYWGLKLYLLTTAEGMPVAWCLATPKLGEREVAAELLAHARDQQILRAGMVVLTDKGLAGRDMERYATEQVNVLLVRADRRDEPRRFGDLAGVRQWIESVNDTLKGQLDLERHGGRTVAGVYARVAQRLLALAAVIWHNWRINAPIKRSLIAYDH